MRPPCDERALRRRLMSVGCIRRSVCVLAAIAGASVSSCGLLSGVDRLQKVQCLDACDGGPDAGSAARDANVPPTDANGPTPDANAGESGGGTSAYRAAVLADGPVGYWRLGESPGATTCHDESGHGHDGNVVGGVLFGAAGALMHDANTGATFDGTTGTIALDAAFDFSGTAPLSWEIWVKPTLLDTSYRPFFSVMTFNAQGDPVDGTYMVAYSQAGATFGFERYGGSTAAVLALDNAALQMNIWTYIVGTCDVGGNGVVYVNGAANITDVSVGSVPAYTANAILGTLLKGELDEVAIYNRALSAQSVLAHWTAASQ
jgi:hypothetical protein